MSLFSKKVSKEEFNRLIETIKNSFLNVKTDISKIKDKTTSNEDEIKEIRNTISYINQSITSLNNKIDSLSITRQRTRINKRKPIIEELELEIPQSAQSKLSKTPILEKLTPVQEEMLKRLAALNRENPNSLISAKDLASELYPESEYSKVRPMISNYLDILEELNLLKKIRKRRQVYIELTEKGKSLVHPFPLNKITFSKNKKRGKTKDL